MADTPLRDIYDTIRIPMTQGMPRTPTPSGYNGTIDQCFINCFPQSYSTPDGQKEFSIIKRQGVEKVTTVNLQSILGAGVNSACWANIPITQLNDVYCAAIYDATNVKFVIVQYRPVTGTAIKIGEITATNAFDQCFLSELTVANVATLGVIWNSSNGTTSKGYYATSAAGVFTAASLTEITDIDFPPKAASPLPLVGGMVQMNGTTYVMTNTGEIHGSDLNSISSWNSLNMIQAISYPDQGVGLMRYKSHVVAFGEDSIEFFSDVGNPAPASPLVRQEQAFIKFGAVHAKALISVDDTLYWLARSSTGAFGLWKLDGYTPSKLSGPAEDQIIDYGSVNTSLYGLQQLSCISVFGQKQIIIGGCKFRAGLLYANDDVPLASDPHSLGINDGEGTLVYNIPEQQWWGWKMDSTFGTTSTFPLSTSQFQLNNSGAAVQYMIMTSTGSAADQGAYIFTYGVDSYYWTDTNGAGTKVFYPVVLQLNRWTNNNERRKRVHKFKAIIETLYSDSHDAETGAYLWFLWAKETWVANVGSGSKGRFVSVPNSFGRYYVTNLGAARQWSFGLATRNKMGMRIRNLEFDISQGSQ